MSKDLRVIIAGGGQVGLRTARLLDDRGHHVVIIEKDHARADFLSDEYVATVIEGDAARPEILRQAQPQKSDVVAALTETEATNLAVCSTAKRLATVRTVMRVEDDPDPSYMELVDGVVFPAYLGARVAANEIVGVGVRTLEEVTGDLEILDIEVTPEAPVAGKTLESVRLPRGCLIISDSEGGHVGSPETVLQAGKRYIVAVESDVADEAMYLLRG